jgi:flagellar motor switch protein FliG
MRTAKLPKHADELDGVTKTAILLLSLEHEAAEAILASMPAEVVEEVGRVIAHLGEVPADLAAEVVEEFYGLKVGGQYGREGGIEPATSLLQGALDPQRAASVIEQIQTQVQKTPFAFLQKTGSDNIITFLQDEHPQTIALVVSYLPHQKASEILMALPGERQIEVVRRVAHMEQTSPDVIREVEAGLAARFSSMVMPAMERVGGIEAVAEVLNLCDRNSEKSILEGIEADDPELVDQIRRLMFVFEDILLVDDKGIQAVLKEVDNDELCLSLKTASEDLQEKIFSNMSSRASDLIKEEMQYLGPVRLSDVEAAQQRIVDIVRRLEDAGEIVIAGRGGEGDLIV